MSRPVRTAAAAAALLGSVATATAAANALVPLGRHRRASVASFAAGVAVSELPWLTLGAQAVLGTAALAAGAGRTRAGRFGTALGLGSGAALALVAARSRPAAGIMHRALVDALGADYRDHVVHPAWPPPDAPLGRRPDVVRMIRAHRRYVHDGDLPYGPAGRRNHLDIWRRPDLPPDAGAPVLVQVHGGAWIWGNKQGQAHPLMSHLVERGWVCVSLNYRLGPRSTWPDMIVDVKRAVAWVKQNIARYGGDPGFVAITGGSAGGHLTALHALTAGERDWQPGFEDVDTTVVAAVPFYGVYDWTDPAERDLRHVLERRVVKAPVHGNEQVYRDASPLLRVRPDAPPFFLLHGTADTLVPVGMARRFAERLRAVSTSAVAYAELPGAQHAFDVFGSVRAHAAAEAVERFLGVIYGHREHH